MKNRDFNIPRLIIFLVGLIGLVAIFFVIQPTYLSGTWRSPFICISLVLLYVFYGMPLVLSYTKDMKDTGAFTGSMIYYRGVRIYTIWSLVIIALTATTLLPMKLAIVAEIIALFIFILYVYMGSATDDHIVNVAAQENEKTAMLQELRMRIEELKVRTDSLGGEMSDIKERIRRLADDVRYLSPSDNYQAYDYERAMLDCVKYLTTSGVIRDINSQSASVIREQLTELETLYKMRKSIY